MRKLQGLALATSTKRVYKIGLRHYHKFCQRFGLSMLPLKQETLKLFVTYLAQIVAYKTINLYLTAVKHYAICKGYPHDFQKMHQLHLLLRGTKRALGDMGRRKPRFPVTIPILRKIRSFIQTQYQNPTDRKMLWAACSLPFFAFLRSSEYTSPSTQTYDKQSTLQFADVKLRKSRLLLHVKVSKTDPFREGVTLSIAKTGGSTCPVRALRKYLKHHPSGSGPLFQMATGKYLTRAGICKVVKKALAFYGIDSSRYSSHSFRIGAATTAAAAGVPDRTIKALGRWSSDCYQTYICLSLRCLNSIPKAMESISKIKKIWVPS